LTEVEARWMPTFIQSGASAFIVPMGTAPRRIGYSGALFIRHYGSEFHLASRAAARQVLRQTLPDSLDWLAYFMVGDRWLRAMFRVQAKVCSARMPDHDLTQPMQVARTILS